MSKEKGQPLNMLIIEDNVKYVDSLYRTAQKYRILLKHASNLEEGKEIIESKTGLFLSGVILDVVCMKDKRQEVADKSFITAAVKYFGEKVPHLPIVVLTGEPDEYKNLKELYKGTWAVYKKGTDEDEMLKSLKEKAESTDRFKIINQYKDIFEVIEKHLNKKAEEEMISCLSNMNKSEVTEINDNLIRLRRLQARIYIALNKLDPKIVPTEYIDEKEIGIGRRLFSHLSRNKYVEDKKIIDMANDMIFTAASDHGAHVPGSTPKYSPTNYTVQSLIFALMDLILWMGSVASTTK